MLSCLFCFKCHNTKLVKYHLIKLCFSIFARLTVDELGDELARLDEWVARHAGRGVHNQHRVHGVSGLGGVVALS